MADLLDIVPQTACEVVKINDQDVTVHGLSAPALAILAKRFPDILRAIVSGATGADGMGAGLYLCIHVGGAAGPIIAAGLGKLGDERYEQHAATLGIDDQLELIATTLRVTFPNGFNSFVNKLAALLQGADERAKPVKVRLKTSPSQSQVSSDADSLPNLQ